jgi:RNA polymerase sigma factor (sigma-70 family)
MTTSLNDRYEENAIASLLAEEQYQREVASIIAKEFLSEEEEQGLLEASYGLRMTESDPVVLSQAIAARDRLVEAYQPLVAKMARRFSRWSSSLEYMDLVNEGSLGVLHAVAIYPEAVNFHGCFRALVWGAVRFALLNAIGITGFASRTASKTRALVRKLDRARSSFFEVHHREASASELAAFAQLPIDQVYDGLVLKSLGSMQSLEGLYERKEDDAEETLCLSSVFGAGSFDGQGDDAPLDVSVLHQAIDRALTPKQREVIRYKYRFDDGGSRERTDQEVAELLGSTALCVNAHKRAALRRLRGAVQVQEASPRGSYAISEGYQEDYYTATEVKRLLSLSEGTFYRLVSGGSLPGRRHPEHSNWIFPKPAIDALLAERQAVSA